MSDIIEIELDKTTDPTKVATLIAGVTSLKSVAAADKVVPQMVDPVSLLVWVKLAAAAVPVITSVINLIREKDLKGVRLKAGDKTIEVDSANTKDVEALIRAMQEDE